ncbi:cortex morphogenetic protein CmpA [Sutcliffiella cohnii]|nr:MULTISPECIES: cortex morphogenetic protein CmpA [Sutcliffiella]MED4017327.1 cortex morphogenetic protein CmpA [Sutcliffiella cohnii]WBL15352.1 cortex morphogenetic protein CmpA [Sutcliffiella sp. NC1]
MPTWFMKQMQRAYKEKNRYQIKLLNQCWYFYYEKQNTTDIKED